MVRIGKQEWMKRPLDVGCFRNGDLIPEAESMQDWEKAWLEKKPAWCYFENDVRRGFRYGRLYNQFAVVDARELAPTGWLIPTYQDIENLGQTVDRISREKHLLTISLEEFGFLGLLGGKRIVSCQFYNLHEKGWYWTKTSRDPSSNSTYALELDDYLFLGCSSTGILNGEGLSVLCFRNL